MSDPPTAARRFALGERLRDYRAFLTTVETPVSSERPHDAAPPDAFDRPVLERAIGARQYFTLAFGTIKDTCWPTASVARPRPR